MKYLIICLAMVMTFDSIAQNPEIEFSKGNEKFGTYIWNKLTTGHLIFRGEVDTLSKYIELVVDFDSKGNIVQTTVFSTDDDSLGSAFFRAVNSTSGMWKNNSKKPVTIIQPMFWEYVGHDGVTRRKIHKISYQRKSNTPQPKVIELPICEVQQFKPQK